MLQRKNVENTRENPQRPGCIRGLSFPSGSSYSRQTIPEILHYFRILGNGEQIHDSIGLANRPNIGVPTRVKPSRVKRYGVNLR